MEFVWCEKLARKNFSSKGALWFEIIFWFKKIHWYLWLENRKKKSPVILRRTCQSESVQVCLGPSGSVQVPPVPSWSIQVGPGRVLVFLGFGPLRFWALGLFGFSSLGYWFDLGSILIISKSPFCSKPLWIFANKNIFAKTQCHRLLRSKIV